MPPLELASDGDTTPRRAAIRGSKVFKAVEGYGWEDPTSRGEMRKKCRFQSELQNLPKFRRTSDLRQ